MSSPPATVYLLHGLLGTAYAHFGPQITAWRADLHVVPIDLPGHGRCPVDAGPRYLDQSLAYLIAVLDRFGPGRLVAASHLGGPLAVRLAAARPDLVTSLALTGFVPGLDRGAFLGLLAGFHRLAEENPAVVAGYRRLHGDRWRATLDAFGEHAAADFATTVLVTPLALAALDTDVLICNGSHKSVEAAAAREAHRYGPRVRGLLLDGAGHIASTDAPAAFLAAVAKFWTAATRSAA